jgi:hypothetical protein
LFQSTSSTKPPALKILLNSRQTLGRSSSSRDGDNFNPRRQPRVGRPPAGLLEHPGLDIQANDLAVAALTAQFLGDGEGEEPRSDTEVGDHRPRFQIQGLAHRGRGLHLLTHG